MKRITTTFVGVFLIASLFAPYPSWAQQSKLALQSEPEAKAPKLTLNSVEAQVTTLQGQVSTLQGQVSTLQGQDFCVAVNGGFGSSGGTTFVGKGFIYPTTGTCKPWAGIVKTASTVVAISTGAACLSDDGKLLTITLSSSDPEFFGAGIVTDRIELCPLAATQGCPAHSGQVDSGFFSGPAAQQTCTTALTTIPSSHD